MKKLVIVQTVTPDYRAVFFDTIQAALGNRFELYAGDFYPGRCDDLYRPDPGGPGEGAVQTSPDRRQTGPFRPRIL